ncbi:contact-dependent growth inhibition system immunity protein [Goodfellowiella coeruleoviolacea]|nr:contact-dependent growth inhibition system immunity protein [Goodfellowiella coeruleoviolacea]
MKRPAYLNRSLEELDGQRWGDPPADSTYLITTVLQLRRKPVGEVSTEDFRILIGQQVGLPWLVPLALQQLRRDPLAQGDFYPGDLLGAVLRVNAEFWAANPALAHQVHAVLDLLPDPPRPLPADVERFRAQAPTDQRSQRRGATDGGRRRRGRRG